MLPYLLTTVQYTWLIHYTFTTMHMQFTFLLEKARASVRYNHVYLLSVKTRGDQSITNLVCA